MIFSKGENVQWDFEDHGGTYQCICCDEDTAVFAPIVQEDDCTSVKFTGMFAVSNDSSLNDVIVKSYKKLH